jgi:hypothetical protein
MDDGHLTIGGDGARLAEGAGVVCSAAFAFL